MNLKTTMSATFLRRLSLVMIVGFLVSVSMSVLPFNQSSEAQSVEELQQKAEQLEQKIQENEEKAEDHHHEAESLREKIADLDGDIVRANNKIELTTLKIEELQQDLVEAEKELERQKGLLKASMRALYKRGGASTVEMLVASDSFSEFIDEQEYLDRLKSAIQDSTNEVIELREQIEKQKKEQEGLLKEQETNRQELREVRLSRQRLLEETEGQEARYRQIVEELHEQKVEAEAALIAALSTGSYKAAAVGPVSAGDIVGGIGNTGLSTGDHLHLETRRGGGATDPAPHIRNDPVDMPPGWVSQWYGGPGGYGAGQHSGIDYAGLNTGAPIYAIDDGYMYRGCSDDVLGTSGNAYGYVAIVEHSNGLLSIYGHMSGGPPECDYNVYPWFF